MASPVGISFPLRGASQHSLGSSPGCSLPPCSPTSIHGGSYGLGVSGASPPYRGGSSAATGDKANPYLAAKKFWKRLCFDPALDPTEYSIGFVETVQQPERRSGVEAWSMRLHDRLLELPYLQFVERFCGAGAGVSGGGGEGPSGGVRHASPGGIGGGSGGGGGFSLSGAWGGPHSTSDEAASDVPYHRIAYFKHGGGVVWESEYHKRRLSDLPSAPPGAPPSDGGGGGSTLADRSRRRSSREGMLPPPGPTSHPTLPGQPPPGLHLPPHGLPTPSPQHSWLGGAAPSPQYAWLGGSYTPPPRAKTPGGGRGGSSNGAAGRSPRGVSPTGSDDGGLDGGSSDDGGGEDLLLLLEEEEEEEDAEGEEEEGEEEEAEALGMEGGASFCGTEAALPHVPQLPEECWMAMLRQLGVREVCMVGGTRRWLRQLASDPAVWRAQHQALWGTAPEAQLPAAVVRRMCRRSQLRAARWLEAAVRPAAMGFPSTTCLQMDDSKVVSADGNAVRLWSHASGRRIATLQGHPGRVTALAFDESLLVSGCAGAVVKLWSMDELRCKWEKKKPSKAKVTKKQTRYPKRNTK
ncbi:Cell division control protein 4 [Tetrabaena socialis]|uniref:Cell division control protein 4 n=1 Tax=Tetrabaena socialis TaxID=47790 RepID=A0A2J8A0V3_9CHLO|nr:Cell division control protein 4 [Tetrabaena socialis]|eukprot:PNH06146.1 Cell division control protein 4 [Tetrabaena socialis]